MPDGPLDGQAGCGPDLVCATADSKATAGLCAATCSATNPECGDGMDCLACVGTDIAPWGVCVTTSECPDRSCTVVGCN
jgi:hypothetical protein